MIKPSAPMKITWIIGLACGILGIIGHYTHVEFLSENNYILLLIGFLALAAGTTFRQIQGFIESPIMYSGTADSDTK